MQIVVNAAWFIDNVIICFFLLFFLFSCKQVVDDVSDENHAVTPVIYEDNDESDEESEDAMETDQDSKEEEASDGLSDIEGSDGIIQAYIGCLFDNIWQLMS